MDNQLLARRVERACAELGLDVAISRSIVSIACDAQPGDDASAVAVADCDGAGLREENRRLQGERERWEKTEREIMQLLGTKNPQKIIHDLRNVLNELSLLQALTSDNV